MKTKVVCMVTALFIFLGIGLSGCGSAQKDAQELINYRRGQTGDVCLEEHAGLYIELFKQDYPDMEITKIRWQSLSTGAETYVIEGHKDGNKSIVKYLTKNQMVLGRTERPLLETEMAEGACIEKPLVLEELLTQTELCEIAVQELGGEMHELKIYWRDEIPLAYTEVRDEKLRVQGIMLNAITGEILH